jgi:hypothetical protein
MNMKLTDFEETKPVVIEHYRALHKKMHQPVQVEERDLVLDVFF